LVPLINQLAGGAANDTSTRPATSPLVFQLGAQMAIINNNWKIVRNPAVGQCEREHGSFTEGTFLFNLDVDHTESVDVSQDPANAERFKNMTSQLETLAASITHSALTESLCAADAPSPPPPPPPSPPLPPTPPSGGFELQQNGLCLSMTSLAEHTPVVLGPCNGGSKWTLGKGSADDAVTEGGAPDNGTLRNVAVGFSPLLILTCAVFG
jgi:hypothetical protein